MSANSFGQTHEEGSPRSQTAFTNTGQELGEPPVSIP